MSEEQHKYKAEPIERKFTAALFAKWHPKAAPYSILVTKDLTTKVIPAPIYGGTVAFCRTPALTVAKIPPMGLLSDRDSAKPQILANSGQLPNNVCPGGNAAAEITKQNLVPRGHCMPQRYTGQGTDRYAGQLRYLFSKTPYHALTPVELSERASGETWARKQSPRKAPATNDTYCSDFLRLTAEAKDGQDPNLSSGRKKSEANLKRYTKGETMISKGISATGYQKLRLFGRCVENQAYRSNRRIKERKQAWACHMTLTVPGQYPQVLRTVEELDPETGELVQTLKLAPDYTIIKGWFTNLVKSIAYHVARDTGQNNPLYYCWVIEEQERGAPHYHILFAHFMPKNAVKALWAKQINGWRAEQGLENLTPGEQNATATLRGVRSYANYLTKYFLKQDMAIPGQCWGLSQPAQVLIKANQEMPVAYFESAEHANEFIAQIANKAVKHTNAQGKRTTAVFTNLMQRHGGYIGRLSGSTPKYKPPAVWLSNPNTAYECWQQTLGKLLSPNLRRRFNQIRPQSAIFGGREAVPLYTSAETINLDL